MDCADPPFQKQNKDVKSSLMRSFLFPGADMIIQDDETLEDLQLQELKIIQKKNGFRFGMDSVLLADFARIHQNDTVVDFGTGTGIIPLLLSGRNKGKKVIGIEIIPEMAAMASRSVLLNKLEDRIQIICGDVKDSIQWLAPNSIHSIVCNPPYGIPGRTLSSESEIKRIARHQIQETLPAFFSVAWKLLKGKGKIFLVYPAPQMLELMDQLRRHRLEPKHFRLVYPYIDRSPVLVLLEAVKDAKPMLHPMPPLILYDHSRNLTNELKSIYHMNEQTEVGFNSEEL